MVLSFVSPFHLHNGLRPIKWTCTAFFRPRQLTDRAILAIRQTQEKKKRVEDWIMLVWLVCSFAVSPGTWPGGAWVPGGPRPCFWFLLLLLVHDPNLFCHNFHQDVSRFTVHKGLRPNSRIMYRFFTSHQPMMNEQDQVYMNQLACEQKKNTLWRSLVSAALPLLSRGRRGICCTAGVSLWRFLVFSAGGTPVEFLSE